MKTSILRTVDATIEIKDNITKVDSFLQLFPIQIGAKFFLTFFDNIQPLIRSQ